VNPPEFPERSGERSAVNGRRDEGDPAESAGSVNPPNVLVVLIDDVGFGASSAFGGPCRTPTAERLADDGLSYTRFHTTALCSPTRAALLTGRNHHTCGMGTIPEMGTPVPGYSGVRPDSTATIARMLSDHGYTTGAFGKMHQTPPWEATTAGPFDRWPTGDGFDRFYGFLGAETNQFSPTLFDGVTPIEFPGDGQEGYHLSEDLVDRASAWIDSVTTSDPAKPWFCYLSFGACHAPFQVPPDWRDRYRGEFAHGWDEQRERTLARQKELGIVPEDAELAPWVPGVPHWEELSDTQRTVAERLMEVYAAFLEHTDVQTGRLIDALERSGQLENTLVVYVIGDNGASAEGGLEGTFNEFAGINGFPDTAERMAGRLDELGGPNTYALYPVGWAVAMDTPYQWTKQVASHYGGTRNGMIVHWPAGVAARGERRQQWHHVIDVVPTILEAAGLPEPTVVDGVQQQPIQGVSFAYTFDDPDAADRHTTQYFEMWGNRGIYHEGWTASAQHRMPWQMARTDVQPFEEDVWELYDTRSDWTQARDVAAEFPEKLEELKQLFQAEAAKHQVLPLEERPPGALLNPALAGRRDLMVGRRSMTLRSGQPGLREDAAPNVKNTSFAITVDLEVPDDGADGVLVAQGGRFGGWSLYVNDGRPVYCHNLFDMERMYVRADRPLTSGPHIVEFHFAYDGGGVGKGGTGTIVVDGEEVATGRIDRTTPFRFSMDETLDIGIDRSTPVTDEYGAGRVNAYGGTISAVRVDLGDDSVGIPVEERQRIDAAVH
jgi:arylsulfatase